MKFLYLLLLLWSQASFAQLTDESYLNKLSHSLRGINPSYAEYKSLIEARKNSQLETFFSSKRAEYLNSPFYFEKMRWRMTELFKLAPSSTPFNVNPELPNADKSRLNATDELFLSLFKENNSWDSLLTGHQYRIFAPQANEVSVLLGLSPLTHFSQLVDEDFKNEYSKLNEGESLSLKFDENEGRVAGILTSPRFFDRYATTAVNKNRRRAAALFRTFLCDNMVAAVPDPAANRAKIYDLQYPQKTQDHFSESELVAASQMGDGQHGTQADCMSCHYKLDPMGKVFLGSPVILSGYKWPGALSFKNAKSEIVFIPVKNINELGQAISQQPEYLNCQMKHFWDWFIGKDIPLSQTIMSELVEKFIQVDRKPNDFVNYLVQRAEFKLRRVEEPAQTTSRRTKEIFQKCQSCHLGKSDDVTGEPLIDLTQWPLGKDTSIPDLGYWLRRVSKKLDLENGGRKRSMPPESSNWNLTREELKVIQEWIGLNSGQEQVKELKP
jgi:hypothetical protein